MMKKDKKPILCIDFDGVIHSYSSGWKGPRTIPDPPVDGAIEFLIDALDKFQVAIYSSRSRYLVGGRRAMKKWLYEHFSARCFPDFESIGSQQIKDWVATTAFADPWEEEVHYAARRLVRAIKWPLFKPAAMVQLDDRAVTFNGTFPKIEQLASFTPWNKDPVETEITNHQRAGWEYLWTYYIKDSASGTISALFCIIEELKRAEHKHPTWPHDPIRAANIVLEEALETLQAANDFKPYDPDNNGTPLALLEEEAAQTGAMAIRFLRNSGHYIGSTSPAPGKEEITLDDIIAWADGIRGALGTEYANRVTVTEATLAERILSDTTHHKER